MIDDFEKKPKRKKVKKKIDPSSLVPTPILTSEFLKLRKQNEEETRNSKA